MNISVWPLRMIYHHLKDRRRYRKLKYEAEKFGLKIYPKEQLTLRSHNEVGKVRVVISSQKYGIMQLLIKSTNILLWIMKPEMQ